MCMGTFWCQAEVVSVHRVLSVPRDCQFPINPEEAVSLGTGLGVQ